MPRTTTKVRIRGEYYTWLVGTRDGVYYADARGIDPTLGRHSLSTKDRKVAFDELKRLDLRKAVERGRVSADVLRATEEAPLSLSEGWEAYRAHVGRPPVMGGATAKTLARYQAVFDKFAKFAADRGVRYWPQVTETVLTAYGTWLHDKDYAGRTVYLELTTLKQLMNWFVLTKRLPASCDFAFELEKQRGTTTYCYSRDEVTAMLAHCRSTTGLSWMGDVIETLAQTGLRIAELAGLRWEHVDLRAKFLCLTDTTRAAKKSGLNLATRTKSGRPRTIPIRPEILALLERLKRYADGRVFHGPHGGRLKPDTVRNVLRREVLAPLAKRFPAGPNGRGIVAGRLHSFRHFFCSYAADSGVNENMLKEWLGHRDSDMIRHYYHMRSDEALRQIDLVPALNGVQSNSVTVETSTQRSAKTPGRKFKIPCGK